jgi:hypothetical protein
VDDAAVVGGRNEGVLVQLSPQQPFIDTKEQLGLCVLDDEVRQPSAASQRNSMIESTTVVAKRPFVLVLQPYGGPFREKPLDLFGHFF